MERRARTTYARSENVDRIVNEINKAQCRAKTFVNIAVKDYKGKKYGEDVKRIVIG